MPPDLIIWTASGKRVQARGDGAIRSVSFLVCDKHAALSLGAILAEWHGKACTESFKKCGACGTTIRDDDATTLFHGADPIALCGTCFSTKPLAALRELSP